MTSTHHRLWRAPESARYFLVPDGYELAAGAFAVVDDHGRPHQIAMDSLTPFEVTEVQARRWAKDELGQALEELRRGFDDKLGELRQRLDEFNRRPVAEGTKVTRETASALLDLAKELPGVLGKSLSGDPGRIEAARETMARLRRRLADGGIDLDDRFTRFPDRLAELRRDVERERAAKEEAGDERKEQER